MEAWRVCGLSGLRQCQKGYKILRLEKDYKIKSPCGRLEKSLSLKGTVNFVINWNNNYILGKELEYLILYNNSWKYYFGDTLGMAYMLKANQGSGRW